METNPTSVVERELIPPGRRTTEFWITLALIALAVLGGVEGFIPPEHALAFATFSASLYKAMRIGLKAWQGHLDLQATLAEVAVFPPLLVATGPDANGQAREANAIEPYRAPEAVRQPSPMVPDVRGGFVLQPALLALAAVTMALLALVFVSGCSRAPANLPTNLPAKVFEEHGWEPNPRLLLGRNGECRLNAAPVVFVNGVRQP